MTEPAPSDGLALLNGATRLHVIVGDPIAQVKSPNGMTRGFLARGRNAMMMPVHVSPANLSALVRELTNVQNLDGIVVTIPHKFACFDLCASTSERSRFLGAVNIMRRNPAGGWHGDMFDGAGFVDAIRRKGCVTEGRRALLIGAGGAGTAIGHGLIEAGVSELAVHDADADRRDALVQRLAAAAKVPVRAGSPDPHGFDIVAQATPMGMKDSDPLPFETSRLSPQAFVGCVITSPPASPAIVAARALGCKTSVGIDMYESVQKLMLDFLLGDAA